MSDSLLEQLNRAFGSRTGGRPQFTAEAEGDGYLFGRMPAPTEPEHGADWSDWDVDHPEEGPSCKCGYNGTPEECAASRAPTEPEEKQ